MKNLFLLNRSGMSPDVTSRKSRHALESIVSRFSLASLICVLMLTIGSGNAWGAETLVYTLDGTVTATGSAYATASSVTQSSKSWKVTANTEQNPWRVGGKSITKTDRPIYNATGSSLSDNISKVEISSGATASSLTVNSLTLIVSTAENGGGTVTNSETKTSGIASSTVTFTRPTGQDWSGKYFKIVYNVTRTSSSGNGYITFNYAKFYKETGGGSTPTISQTSDFSTFTYSNGSPVAQSFTVSGSNLKANLVVTAPTNYEVCTTQNGTYTSSVSFTPSTGTVSNQTVYVRLQGELNPQNYNRSGASGIRLTSTGATEVDVAVNGMVPFTVTWQANGSTFATTYVGYGINPGSNLGTIPGDPDVSCGGKVFYGWHEGDYNNASIAPTLVTTDTKITTNKTYNAVFATSSGGGTSSITITNSDFTGALDNSYGDHTITKGDYTFNINACEQSSKCQMRNNTGCYIQIPTLPGAITNISTTACYNTSNGNYTGTIRLKSADAAGDAVTNDLATKELSSASSFSWDITGSITTAYFKTSAGLRLQDLTITYSTATYSNYSTTCAACSETPSITGVSLTGSAFSTTSVPVQATGVSAGANCSLSSYGFYWGTSASPSGNSTASNNLSAGTFSATLTGPFTIGTQYYYRAWATNNGENTGYSSDGTFTLQNVTFNMHGHGGDAPATQVVPQGGKATNPGDPSAAGYTFDGWWDNSSYTGSAWDFSTNTVGSGGVTLHAKWSEKPKYTITLNAGNGTVSADGWTAGASPTWSKTQANGDESITLPSASCNCAGWEFQGWATSSVDQVAAPSMTSSGASVLPASNTTYYAVYRQNATGGTTYNKITSTGDLTTGDYLFVSTYDAAMENAVNGTRMEEETSGFTASNSSITTSNTNVIWTIIKFGSQVVIKNGSNFLGVNESNEICLTTTPHLFTYSYSSTYWVFTSVSKPSYQLMYGGSPSYFRMGTAQGGTYVIYLYKQGAGMTGNYKTNPSCSDLTITGVANPVAGGTVTLSATSAKEGDKVYAICTPDAEYNFTNWSISGTSVSPTSATTQFVEITVGSGNVTATANFSAKVMYDVTWKANGSTLTGGDLGSASTRVENGHNITTLPPTPTSCETGDGKSENFIGWVVDAQNWPGKTNDLTSITIYKKASEFPAVSGNVTYHAVWAATDETKNEWVKVTAVADVEAGFKYAVISYDDAYYVKNTDQTTNKPAVQTVTKTAGDINFTSDMEFNVTAGLNDGFIFTSASVANVKIWGGTANDGVRVNTNADTYDEWFVELNATYGVIMTATSSKYLSTYGTQDWRNYVEGTLSSTNRPANLYKYALGYKNYMTSCCTANDITLNGSGTVSGGTFSADASSACEGATITLSTSICSGYTVGDWDVYKTGESSTKVSVTDNAFTMPAYGVTVALSTTIRQDHYIDKLHNSTGYTGTGALREGCSYSVPDDISNTTPGSGCENEHYVFVGWVDAGHVAADGSLLSGYSLFKGGTKDASGTTYYAIWAKDIE